jgi:hypothetical protein
MKKCFAIFFLLIFSFQVMPVKAIGRIIAKGQTTEEVKDYGIDDEDGKGKLGEDFFFGQTTPEFAGRLDFDKEQIAIIHKAASLPPTNTREVQSPPPDSI